MHFVEYNTQDIQMIIFYIIMFVLPNIALYTIFMSI